MRQPIENSNKSVPIPQMANVALCLHSKIWRILISELEISALRGLLCRLHFSSFDSTNQTISSMATEITQLSA